MRIIISQLIWLVAVRCRPYQECEDYASDGKISFRQNDTCFILIDYSAKAVDHNETCRHSFDGQLAIINTQQRLDQLNLLTDRLNSYDVFIGLQREPRSTSFYWDNGEPFGDLIPRNTVYDGYANFQCVSYDNLSGKVVNKRCDYDTSRAVCQAQHVLDPARKRCLKLKGIFLGSSCYFIAGWNPWAAGMANVPENDARPARLYTQEIANRVGHWFHETRDKLWTALGREPSSGQLKWLNSNLTVDEGSDLDIRPMIQVTPYYQRFARLVGGKRMQATNDASILVQTTVTGDERMCAFRCIQREGCLSFNFARVDGRCEGLAFKSEGNATGHGHWVIEPGFEYYERVH